MTILPGVEPLAVWLRDQCSCEQCRHPGGQRLLDPVTLPDELRAAAVEVEGDVVKVAWEPGGHRSTYSLSWLISSIDAPTDRHRARRFTWDTTSSGDLPVADHGSITVDPEGLRRWLGGVERYGCGVLHGVPVVDGEVARVAELFSHVRVTNYGRFFDVRSVVDPTNLANTSLGLAAHTDNPYRDPVPTMQLLHCLSSSAAGGDSLVVDGWRAADEVRRRLPDAFAALVSQAVPFEYRGDGAVLSTSAPLVELDTAGQVRSVRFNSRSMRTPVMPAETMARWYEGYLLFARLLADPAYQIRFRLDPGDLFIVDNRRVLHGRTGFDATAGERHLQGCYADIDGLRSTIATLSRPALVGSAAFDALDRLFTERGGTAYLGEPVSMREHMLLSAHVAETAGATPAQVVAALCHDVGHLVHDLLDGGSGEGDWATRGIDTRHEDAGAQWLAQWFGPEVTEPVRLHVEAKRYLTAVEPGYLATLSPASVLSLEVQGGPHTPDDAEAFAGSPHAAAAVAVRRWDDGGKSPASVPGLDHYRAAIEACARR